MVCYGGAMSEKPRHALWGQDTSRWSILTHVVAWAIFLPCAYGVAWLAGKLTDFILPF